MGPSVDPQIDLARLPRHVGIIMDGNGRWAKKRFLPRIAGHREGVKAVDRVVSHARRMGIKALTLYSFSSENWNRPRSEIEALMEILGEYLKRELRRMIREDIRFNAIGHLEELPEFAQDIIRSSTAETAQRQGMVLTLALSYGSRQEIVDAAKKIASEVRAGKIEPENVEESDIARFLYTTDLPELDLLIRTSGEIRLSNYLLWQAAYAELYFTDVYWPDFEEKDLEEAVHTFQSRIRKFGLTEDQTLAQNG
jgi:undecaprenyl diphosphate synthase